MADKTILELTNIGQLEATDLLPIARPGTVSDNSTSIGNIAEYIEDDINNEVAHRVDGAVSGNLAALDANGDLTDSDIAANDVAKKDGYYGQMGVGVADNLAGRGTVPAEYTFRTSGGTADLGTGSASIEKLMGKTLVWNQLLAPMSSAISNEVTFTSDGEGGYTINGTATGGNAYLSFNNNFSIAGHVYLVKFSREDVGVALADNYNSSFSYKTDHIISSANYRRAIAMVVEQGTTVENVYIKPVLFDLTIMFGAGNEPSTVAEFEALYPLDYYAYNAGTLINVTANGIKTTGFNLFNPATGKAVIPSPTSADTTSGTNCIQISGTYTSVTDGDGNEITPSAGGYFNVGAATELTVVGGNATDTCIHYTWSGYRNGEYEPYEEHIIYFNGEDGSVATVTGKVNGEGSSVTIFPDGMKSAGTVHDEYNGYVNGYLTKGTKRLKVVNLGDLTWNYSSGGGYFFTTGGPIPDSVIPTGWSSARNFVCSKYTALFNTDYTHLVDKSCILNDRNVFAGNSGIIIKDSSYTDATTFKTVMDGVELYYELATPIDYTLDEPMPANYYVNDFGTEERLPADTASVVAAPIFYNVQYAMNAVDTLRRLPVNYISTASMENFTTELATKLGTFLNATITVTPTYDSDHEEYDYSITIVENQQEP